MSTAFSKLRPSKNAHALVADMIDCGDNGKRIRVVYGDETIILRVTRKSNFESKEER